MTRCTLHASPNTPHSSHQIEPRARTRLRERRVQQAFLPMGRLRKVQGELHLFGLPAADRAAQSGPSQPVEQPHTPRRRGLRRFNPIRELGDEPAGGSQRRGLQRSLAPQCVNGVRKILDALPAHDRCVESRRTVAPTTTASAAARIGRADSIHRSPARPPARPRRRVVRRAGPPAACRPAGVVRSARDRRWSSRSARPK